MSKPVHHHIRAYDYAVSVLQRDGTADTNGNGLTPEARQILTCVGKPADRARRKAEKGPSDPKKKEWDAALLRADDACSQYIRFRDTKGGPTLSERIGSCNTCQQRKKGSELQCCHWLSRKYFGTRWHEFNLGAGCWGCNSKMIGNGRPKEFEAYIVMVHGSEWPDKLRFKAKVNARKPTVLELNKITDEFKNKLAQLKAREGIDG